MIKIALLNSLPSETVTPILYTKLQKYCQQYGATLDILKNSYFVCQFDQNGSQIWYQGKKFNISEYQLAFLRFAIKAPHAGDHYISREFISSTIPVINSPDAIIQTRDKLQTLQNLSRLGLPVTPTFIVRTRDQISEVLEKIGPGPYIIKNIFGSGGQAVLQAFNAAQVYAMFDYIWNLNRNEILMIQPYLGSTPASDVRVLYFNNVLWRAILRSSQYDFRTNVHIGATTEPTILTAEEKKICDCAVRSSGLVLAGLDFLRTSQGPMILEINGCPGFTGISEAYQKCGIDIVTELAEKLVQYCNR